MKKLGIIALLMAALMIFTSVALAEYTIDEYRWRYSGSTLKKGHGGKNSPHLKQYVCNVQGDVNVSNLGKCGKRDGIYGNVTVDGVSHYQDAMGLTPDGQTGFNTKNKLYEKGKDREHWTFE